MGGALTLPRLRHAASTAAGVRSRIGPALVRALAGEGAAQLSLQAFGAALRAVVLTGSMARDEASTIPAGDGWRVLGDAEFLLMFHDRRPLPSRAELGALAGRAEDWLRQRGCACPITFNAAAPGYLRRLQPHIFAYELREAGRVVWGDRNVLALIPHFRASDISREDAWHLLSNRLIEQLEALARCPRNGGLPAPLQYATVKLYLDMATSYLVFAGAYAPSYRERQRRLAELASRPTQPPAPLVLPEFARQIETCTRWKMAPSEMPDPLPWPFWRAAARACALLWHWELLQLADSAPSAGADWSVAWRQMARRHSLVQRMRGWCHLWRHHAAAGVPASWRWLTMARQATPRLWIYRAAATLFFLAPALLCDPGAGFDTERRRQIGDCLMRPCSGDLPWRQLAMEIAGEYRYFVANTRS